MNDALLAGLNPEQQQAVTTTEGPLLVLAGAGSGKTRVITQRIAWLIARQHVRPWQILAMTFTNKAAAEMRARVQTTCGDAAADLWLGTFHSVGVRLLRQLAGHAGLRPDFAIYDADDSLRTVGRVLKAMGHSDKVHPPRKFTRFIDRAKNRCLLPGDPLLETQLQAAYREPTRDDQLQRDVYRAYEDELRRANAVDFGDLILRPVRVLAQHAAVRRDLSQRFRYVLVDEFQDTNHAQFELLKLLCSTHANLCVVGDDDQSIYSWRGAQVRNILDFPQVFRDATVVKLERNYRSTGRILAASTAVVAVNRGRHGKTLWTEAGLGAPIVVHAAAGDREEANWVARKIDGLRSEVGLNECAVFYRTNALSRVLEDELRVRRVPYAVIGGLRFFERAEVKDALAWFRAVVCPDDTEAFLRASQSPRRGIGDATLDACGKVARRDGLSVPSAARAMAAQGELGRAQAKMAAFLDVLADLRKDSATRTAPDLGLRILTASGLEAALRNEGTEEAADRLANLQELLKALQDHADTAEDMSMRGFLERTALVADADQIDKGGERVALMTVHTAKGLEYDAVFVVGLEDGLFPHANSMAEEDRDGLEEERRLMYVAMTRARKYLHLSLAHSRRRFGGVAHMTNPSRFLAELPAEYIVRDDGWGRSTAGVSAGYGAWSRAGDRFNQGSSNRHGAVFAGRWERSGGAAGVAPTGAHHGDADDGGQAQGCDDVEIQRRESARFAAGHRVLHGQFGAGQVLQVDESGSHVKLTVQFARVGIKRLDARYVRPAE
jgi:DNA helicase-2/ATP-dependent DNA helicase PcrA